ncbi:helix-turn-helix transcriptional regulator [Salmonella enterica]|nr:XRE family transcriptional regulator [Salmonella enterica subsp. enterica]EDA0852348.1 helix-turn-helix transcriptional regulator [Salmonella enterica]EEA7993503.1 helix-turn-helix transcriptional regulator [Salmonella enterica subsp. enterica]EGX5975712.1 XRE family transcriptional regulator [Salmonella enterica]HAG2571176.1 helix-turn-helix transcriptional regulator [Salmonella enterica]
MEKNADTEKCTERTFNVTTIERFSERLKEAMRGMSNHEIARRSGLSEAAIRKYVKGESYPTIDNAAKVADACGVSLSWLLTEQESSRLSINDNTNHSSRASNKTHTKKTDQATIDGISLLLSGVASSDAQSLFQALCNVGIKGILNKLQQPDDQRSQPKREYTREEQEAMLRALPISEKAKNTASLVLALGDDAQKEIFEILEDFKRRIAPEGNADSPTVTPDPSLKQKAG